MMWQHTAMVAEWSIESPNLWAMRSCGFAWAVRRASTASAGGDVTSANNNT